MRKKLGSIIIILIILILILILFISTRFTGYLVKKQKKQVEFYFYDELTNCSLNGYVFSDNKLIGKSDKGYFNLSQKNYKENLNPESKISIFGELGDCFNKNSNLLFNKYFTSPEIKNYHFLGESTFTFKTKINPNNPSKKELLGFVQPENRRIKQELRNINLDNKNNLEALSNINNYLNNKINYTKDWEFNKTNYWQTPLETLKKQKGDCEDYSTTLLSLFLAYNNSLNCYNIVFTSHVTTLCHINNYYVYYDQEKTELKKKTQTKKQLEKLKLDYFEHYGLNNTEKTHYIFNDNQYIGFKNDEDFINWQHNLKNIKSNQNIFQTLEYQFIELQKKYPAEFQELTTQKPSIQLTNKKPTLAGFFKNNFLFVFPLLLVFILLIVILIKINKK